MLGFLFAACNHARSEVTGDWDGGLPGDQLSIHGAITRNDDTLAQLPRREYSALSLSSAEVFMADTQTTRLTPTLGEPASGFPAAKKGEVADSAPAGQLREEQA